MMWRRLVCRPTSWRACAGIRLLSAWSGSLSCPSTLRELTALVETLRRHATKANASGYGARELAERYVPEDLLGVPHEKIIRVGENQDEIVSRVVTEALPARLRPGNAPPS